MGLTWSLLLLTLGWAVAIHGSPILGLAILAMGEYVLMFIVLDDVVQPVNRDVSGFMKLTAAMVFGLSLGYGLWQWQAML